MNRDKINELVVFHVDDQQFALHLAGVEQVIHMIDILPLSVAPDYIAGAINYHGHFLPVINIRKLFRLQTREVELTDQLIVACTPKIKMALWVDSVDELVTVADDQIAGTDRIYLEKDYVEGLFRLRDGMVLINDLDKFLTQEQIVKLEEALSVKM